MRDLDGFVTQAFKHTLTKDYPELKDPNLTNFAEYVAKNKYVEDPHDAMHWSATQKLDKHQRWASIQQSPKGIPYAARQRHGLDIDATHEHHLFPKEGFEQFSDLKIEPNDFTVKVSAIDHIGENGIHSIKNAQGETWEAVWATFFRANPNATREQVFKQANDMIRGFAL